MKRKKKCKAVKLLGFCPRKAVKRFSMTEEPESMKQMEKGVVKLYGGK